MKTLRYPICPCLNQFNLIAFVIFMHFTMLWTIWRQLLNQIWRRCDAVLSKKKLLNIFIFYRKRGRGSLKQKAAAARLHETERSGCKGSGRKGWGWLGPAALTGYASEAPIILLINMISQRTKKATAAPAMPCHLFRFSAFPQPLLLLLLALASFAFYANFTADEHSKRSKGHTAEKRERGRERKETQEAG